MTIHSERRNGTGLRRRAATYWSITRTPQYSLTLVLPLLVAYELLVVLMNRGQRQELRNAADWVVRGLLQPMGIRGTVAVSLALFTVALAVILHQWWSARAPIRLRYYALMLAESFGLAVVFGAIVTRLTSIVLSPLPLAIPAQTSQLSTAQQLTLALGAGVYEELVFRVFLVSALSGMIGFGAQITGRNVDHHSAIALAVLGSALLFSAVHYVGPYGDALELWSFAYRFVAGLVFSLIYALRGYGIVAWTHALYDVFVIAAQH